MPYLNLSKISKSFNGQRVLDKVSLQLKKGNILCILGPSGCGKTTLLRIIAGLEQPDEGEIQINNKDILKTPAHQRQIRMMFQEFALFPHKTVSENISFGLEILKLPAVSLRNRTDEMLSLVSLDGYGDRSVDELSGGERQRVALARSLAPYPRLLMLDEPLGSLDRALRKRLLLDLNRILRKVGVTTIFVTHDHSEALAVSDIIAVMSNSRIEQIDPPELLYQQPKNPTVARFLGFQNIVKGIVEDTGIINTSVGKIQIDHKLTAGQQILLLFRPDGAELSDDRQVSDAQCSLIHGIVLDRLFQGDYYHVRIKTDKKDIMEWRIKADTPPPVIGDPISLIIHKSSIVIMDK